VNSSKSKYLPATVAVDVREGIDAVCNLAHATAIEKGWWPELDKNCMLDANPRAFGEQIALMHSELSEVLEEFREWGLDKKAFLYFSDDKSGGQKPEGIAAEFADVIIRIGDTCARYDIDLGEAIVKKLAYNRSREYRHGGKHA
jgi:NTP pyrophosphatase (non-canonical NTP hydrolase)